MNAAEHRINQVVKEVLSANRPAGVPDSFTIRAAQDIEKVERPYLVASSENGESPHPQMRKLNLILTTHTRVDDAETLPCAEIHQRLVNALLENGADVKTGLAARQLRLRKLVLGATGEEIEDGRGNAHSTVFTIWVQILPVGEE